MISKFKRPRGRPPRKKMLVETPYLPPQRNSLGQRQRVWVAFTDETRLWWLKWLRPGFRHCFALINDGEHWMALEPLSSCLEVAVLPPPPDFNLPDWLRGQGHHVVEATLHRKLFSLPPLAIFNCVEVVKRLLGVRTWRIITPHDLYRHLLRQFIAAQAKYSPTPNESKTNG